MSVAEILKEYWGITMFLIGLVFHAVWTYFQVAEHNKRLDKLEQKQDDFSELTASIVNKISAIDAKLDILLEGYKKDNK